MDNMQETIENMDQECRQLQETLSAVQRENEDLRQKHKDLQRREDDLQRKHGALIHKNARLREENLELQKRTDEMSASKDAHSNARRVLEVEIEVLRRELAEEKAQVRTVIILALSASFDSFRMRRPLTVLSRKYERFLMALPPRQSARLSKRK